MVLAELLRPVACLGCGRHGAWPCCAACLPPEPAGAGPWRLAADHRMTLWALGAYRAALREVVVAGKLRGQQAALAALGRRLGAAMRAAGAGADLVTWVPSAPARGRPRDHAEQIARGVAASLELSVARLLAPPPGRDLGRARGSGVATSARGDPRCLARLTGGRVLLVDDVATTGTTLARCAGALRQAGARSVEAAVLATSARALGPALPPGAAGAGGVPRGPV